MCFETIWALPKYLALSVNVHVPCSGVVEVFVFLVKFQSIDNS